MTTIYREGNLDDFLRIIPELKKMVFGHWKVEPTITVKEDDSNLTGTSSVAFEISYPEASVDLIDEIANLIGAFLDGYICALSDDLFDKGEGFFP